MTNHASQNDVERQADEQILALGQLLVHDEPVPLGLTARLQAHVQRRRRAGAIGVELFSGPRLVIAAAAFATAAFEQELAVAAVGFVVALCYAMLLDLDAEEREVAEG